MPERTTMLVLFGFEQGDDDCSGSQNKGITMPAAAKKPARGDRTREAILEAFISLMVERGYDRMTVQHLLDRAGVGRATFYTHFRSKDDLLSNSINRLKAGLQHTWKAATPPGARVREPLGFSLPFFRHTHGHRRIWDLIIGRPSELLVNQRMKLMLGELVREDLLTRPGAKRQTPATEAAVHFVVGALWALVYWWAANGATLKPEELDQYFRGLVLPGLDAMLGRSPVPKRS